MNAPRYSLIIPAYNESALLPRLLRSIEVARERYRGGADAIEVIVADNSSTDDTATIAASAGCRVVAVEKRCIAAARNGGAREARGEIVCFVDADSEVHPETFNVIDAGLAERVVGGSTGVTLERWSVGLRVTFALMMSMLWLVDMDSGVVFCRREDFEKLGGYDEDLLYAEDVKFYWALRQLGRSRRPRQRLARLRGAKTTTSTRKFDRHGDWHLFPTTLKYLVTRIFRPGWDQRFARGYWYDDRAP